MALKSGMLYLTLNRLSPFYLWLPSSAATKAVTHPILCSSKCQKLQVALYFPFNLVFCTFWLKSIARSPVVWHFSSLSVKERGGMGRNGIPVFIWAQDTHVITCSLTLQLCPTHTLVLSLPYTLTHPQIHICDNADKRLQILPFTLVLGSYTHACAHTK